MFGSSDEIGQSHGKTEWPENGRSRLPAEEPPDQRTHRTSPFGCAASRPGTPRKSPFPHLTWERSWIGARSQDCLATRTLSTKQSTFAPRDFRSERCSPMSSLSSSNRLPVLASLALISSQITPRSSVRSRASQQGWQQP